MALTIHELPTPALLVDIDILEANLARMAELARSAGKALRPHAKAHKCVEIARRQIASGAAGVCAATVNEAELMDGIGSSVLLTSPIADPLKCARIARLEQVMVVVDHTEQVRMYSKAGAKVDVLIDLDVGDHRTGIAPGEPALRLAETVMQTPGLRFRGLQAYSVRASHLSLQDGRTEYNTRSLQAALETKQLLESHGIPVSVISGGSTGSCDADVTLPYLTELQAGSYALMDVAYKRIGVAGFGNSMSVLATVVSANHRDRVTVDAGFKAFSTDRPFGPEPCDLPGARYEWAGDEFGFVYGASVKLAERIRFLPPHCDPTVNLYERIHVCRGDEVLDTWRIK